MDFFTLEGRRDPPRPLGWMVGNKGTFEERLNDLSR